MRERVRQHRRVFTIGGLLLAGVLLAACVPPPPPPPPGAFLGSGFDTCAAPSTGAMGAWLASSPYRVIGIYIGGETRGCPQPNLTASWVSSEGNAGWHMAPLYVGVQAECNGNLFAPSQLMSSDPAIAGYQGSVDAIFAARDATALGFGAGTPIYFDLEAYNANDGVCAFAAMNFVNGWDSTLLQGGWVPGVYSSAASGIADLAAQVTNPGMTLPTAIWIADWNGNTSVFGDPFIADNLWAIHQRIHQYQGGHDEIWGGVDLNIDNDAFDAPLAG